MERRKKGQYSKEGRKEESKGGREGLRKKERLRGEEREGGRKE